MVKFSKLDQNTQKEIIRRCKLKNDVKRPKSPILNPNGKFGMSDGSNNVIYVMLGYEMQTYNKRHKQHWTKSYKWKKKLFEDILWCYDQNTDKFCDIVITQYRYRLLDRDNLVYSCKELLDVLKEKGYIVNDNEKWVKIEYLQKINRKDKHTQVKIIRRKK